MRTALLLVLVLSLGAPSVGAIARTFDIEVGSYPNGLMYMEPSNITVELGDVVTFRVKNPDRIFHDIALLDYAGNDIEIEVPAGKTETHTFNATEAGRDFRLICEVSGHKQKGMQGLLHVVDPAAKKGLPLTPVVSLMALAALALLMRRRA